MKTNMKPKPQKGIKAWAVISARVLDSIYKPADWLNCFTIFASEKQANYWKDTRVHPDNKPKVIEVIITPTKPLSSKKII